MPGSMLILPGTVSLNLHRKSVRHELLLFPLQKLRRILEVIYTHSFTQLVQGRARSSFSEFITS